MASIIVSGIPEVCERKDLVEHFRPEVDHVLFPLGKDTTRALVVLKSQKAAEEALKQSVIIFGVTLKTRPAPRQTYHRCTADVDGLIVASIPDLQLCIRELQTEFGVDVNFSHDNGTMVLTGSLLQIQCAQTKLDTIFREQQETQARELLMVEQDLATPRSQRSMTCTPQREIENVETRLSGTWTGSPSLDQVTQSQQETRYRAPAAQDGGNPQLDAMFSTPGSKHSSKAGLSQTLTLSKSASLRQSGSSMLQSASLNRPSGRGHYNAGQAYRREQSLSQEDGFTVKGIKIQRHSSKEHSGASTLNQDRPASESELHEDKSAHYDPLRHTAPSGLAWPDNPMLHYHSNNAAGRVLPSSSTKQLVLPREQDPQKVIRNGQEFLYVKVELDQDVMGYIKKIHKAEVKELEHRHHVQFSNRWLEGLMEVRITTPLSEEEGGLDNLSAARQAFISFYQVVFYTAVKDTVTYNPSRVPESEVDAVTTAVGKAFASRVYVNSTKPGEIVLVGNLEYLPLVKDWVNKKLAEVKKNYSKGYMTKTKLGTVNGHETKPEKSGSLVKTQSKVAPPDREVRVKTSKEMNGLPTSSTVYEYKTKDGLAVYIYKADIAHLKTRAIVNASNENLHHIGAIALAISEAAGPQLQAQCTDYVTKNGPMRVSEVMSTPSGGQLHCDHVIHSVGPMWCLYTEKDRCGDALRQTFLNTLYYANNKLKVASLATPAISSGVYGVPLDVCTQALYSAIQAFSPAATNLKEVHVVDLEEDAAGMMSIIFQQLAEAEGEGLTPSSSREQLHVEDIETTETKAQCDDLSLHSNRSEFDLNGDQGELREDQEVEEEIQPSRGEMEFMSAPARLPGQMSSDWPESPPPSPRHQHDGQQAVYSPRSVEDSDYEEPVLEEVILAAKMDDSHRTPTFPDSFHKENSSISSQPEFVTSQAMEEVKPGHSQQLGSREASFHSSHSGDLHDHGVAEEPTPRSVVEEQIEALVVDQVSSKPGFTSPRWDAFQSPQQHSQGQQPSNEDYQSPRQQEYQSPRQQPQDYQSPRQDGMQSPGLISPRHQDFQATFGISGHVTPVSRSHQATLHDEIETSQTLNRSGQITPRSGHVTPRSEQMAQRSGQITPRSDHMTPRSGHVTPRSEQSARRSGPITPRSGHMRSGDVSPGSEHIARMSGEFTQRSGHTTARSDHMTPRSGHMTPRSGHMTPRSGQVTPALDHLTPRSGQMTPRSQQVTTGSGQRTPQADHMTPRSGHMTPRSGHATPRSGHATPRRSGQTTPKTVHLLQEVELESPRDGSMGSLTPTHASQTDQVVTPRSKPLDTCQAEESQVKVQVIEDMFSQLSVSPEQPIVPRSTPAAMLESQPWSEDNSRHSSAMQESLPDTETQLLKQVHQESASTDFMDSTGCSTGGENQPTRPKTPDATLSQFFDQNASLAPAPLLIRMVASAFCIAEKGGDIIRHILKAGDLGIVEKTGINDLQTEADRSANTSIVTSLRQQFPGVKVIGEEDEEVGQTEVCPDWLETSQSAEVLRYVREIPDNLRDISAEDVVIWVDPLDGTSEYTQGLLDHVTVLIGISVRGRAVGGVIHQPYYNYQHQGPESADTTLGRTIWGIIGVGAFGFILATPPTGSNIVCTTRSHSNKHVNMAVDSCQPTEVLRVGGSGHKVLLLLEGVANAYVFASPGTKKWDTCGPEAVLHAVGGKLTDMHGNYYAYDEKVSKKNMGGILATAGAEEHTVYLSLIPQEVKNELQTDGPAVWQLAHQITTRLQHMQAPLILRLLASAVSVSEKAGEIVREVMKQGDLGIVDKGINDLQTEADRSAQTCIVASLRKQFPDVAIIGEEGEEKVQPSDVRSDWLHCDQSEAVLEFSGRIPDELRSVIDEEVTVWVDPLDGTAEYTQGLLDHVTVLIGISVRGQAIAGVIYQPFYNYQATTPDVPLGRTIWGMIGVGAFGFTPRLPPHGQNIICTTRSHSNENVNSAVQACEPTEVLRVGGSGHKVLLLLEGEAHAYVFASPGTKKWDTCGPEAVLHANGGRLTDLHGNQYQYGAEVEKKNKGGVLATAQMEPHAHYVQAIPTAVKDGLPSDGQPPWQLQEE